jgi:6-pyruvoyl-tetrahydropterin synthase
MLLHPCRIHLFATIGIYENALQFAALLKKNSTIANYIQELDFTYHNDMTEDLANTFLLLNNIKTLNFYSCLWKSLPPHIQHVFTHLFPSPSISCLYVDNVHGLPATLLSSCSTLKHLTISACKVSSSVTCDNMRNTSRTFCV